MPGGMNSWLLCNILTLGLAEELQKLVRNNHFLFFVLKFIYGGTWMAQSVKRPTAAQVMISQLRGSSPKSGSVLTARSPLWILRPPLSLCPFPHSHSVSHSLFLSKIDKHYKVGKKKKASLFIWGWGGVRRAERESQAGSTLSAWSLNPRTVRYDLSRNQESDAQSTEPPMNP